ncbi:MAG: hypothetical protein ACTSQG_01830 [Promethearchaeota archaeon]
MDKAPYIKYKNIFVVPTFHSRIEFSKLVCGAFFEVYPDVICIELPNNVKNKIIEGIERLPYLSLISYTDSLSPNKLNFIPIDPGDSIIEGIRLGLEHNIPIEFIDLSVKDYSPPTIRLPDDYSLNKVGLKIFYEKISEHFKKNFPSNENSLRDKLNLKEFLENRQNQEKYNVHEKDILREKFMASYLIKIMKAYHRILLIVGMAHWENIKYYLENPDKIGQINLNLMPYKYVELYNIKSKDARFLLKELPYHTYKWLKFRKKITKESLEFIETPEQLNDILRTYNKLNHIRNIFLKAKDDYEEEFKEFINLHKLKTLFQYSRNLSLVEKRLLPNLYHLLITAKNIVDDDYAWKVLKKATEYPYNDNSDKYKTMKLSMKGGYDPNGRYIKLRRYHSYSYDKERDFPLKKRIEEKYPGEWREAWENKEYETVSYPPEDIIEEDYFSYIRKKAIKNLKHKRIKIEEFKSSLLDGIAIKETIRNWSFKKKIYVRNEQQIKGKIDTIVVIFDADDGPVEKYPYKLTWWAEHEQESDMAFYSTYPGDFLIGPGISHVEIGGLLSIFPPPKLKQIFAKYRDYEYGDVKNKAERLLKAAIIYSKERYIAYVANEPPRKYFFSLAGIKNKELIYISLDDFNKESLKKIKHIHILAGKDKRAIAHNYIFLNE